MMLSYKTLVTGELKTNCYLVWNKDKDCLVIDPGDDSIEICEEIRTMGLLPRGIAATHGHFDHVLGVLDLKLVYQIPFYCSVKDKFLLHRCQETAKYYLKREIGVPNIGIDKDLDKTESIKIGQEELRVIKTPGHTPGGICLYSQKEKIVFSGDTIFAGSNGDTTHNYSSAADLIKSIREQLLVLPDEVKILAGHGEETTVEREKRRFNL